MLGERFGGIVIRLILPASEIASNGVAAHSRLYAMWRTLNGPRSLYIYADVFEDE